MGSPKLLLLQHFWEDRNLSTNGVFQVKSIIVDHIEENQEGDGNIGVSAIVRVKLQCNVYREDCGYGTCEFVAKNKIPAYRQAACSAIDNGIRRVLLTFGPMGQHFEHEPVNLGKCPEPLFPGHQSRSTEYSPNTSNMQQYTDIQDWDDGDHTDVDYNTVIDTGSVKAEELFEAFDTPHIAPGEEETGGAILVLSDLQHPTDISFQDDDDNIQTLDMFVDGEVSIVDALEVFSDDEVDTAL